MGGPDDDRLDGQAEQHQRGGVVDQALALDEVDDPPGRAEPGEDAGRRHRVGRRDDGAEHQPLGQAEARDHERAATAATANAVASTSPTDSSAIGVALRRRLCGE